MYLVHLIHCRNKYWAFLKDFCSGWQAEKTRGLALWSARVFQMSNVGAEVRAHPGDQAILIIATVSGY